MLSIQEHKVIKEIVWCKIVSFVLWEENVDSYSVDGVEVCGVYI